MPKESSNAKSSSNEGLEDDFLSPDSLENVSESEAESEISSLGDIDAEYLSDFLYTDNEENKFANEQESDSSFATKLKN